jgi:peptidase E
MRLILTSDFPSDGNEPTFQTLFESAGIKPCIAVIPPTPLSDNDERRQNILSALESHGIDETEFFDITRSSLREIDNRLHHFDVIYLTGGDPSEFRNNLERTQVSSLLVRLARSDKVLIGASGGAMQFCKSMALFCLHAKGLDATLEEMKQWRSMGLVSYELLPHLNRFDDEFVKEVRRYSAHVDHDIVALRDGVAVMHDEHNDRTPIGGDTVTFRGGNIVG